MVTLNTKSFAMLQMFPGVGRSWISLYTMAGERDAMTSFYISMLATVRI